MERRIEQCFSLIDSWSEDMAAMLEHLVRLESPSSDAAAVGAVAAHLDTWLDAIGMEREKYTFPGAGPTLAAWTKPGRLPPVLLLGHMDTVHPVGSFGETPWRRDGNTACGPGVYDMKGGIVIAAFALKALLQTGCRDRQLKLLLTGDEEVAHAFSDGEGGHLAELHAEGCAACFNTESGNPGAEVTVRRKGGAIFRICIHGRAAHAGRNPEQGISAIRQAAYMITAIENRSEPGGVTWNCGRIKGGTGANVIPDYCELSVGLRYHTNAQFEESKAFLRALCDAPAVPGAICELSQNGFYPAMEPTEKSGELLEIYGQACGLLGEPAPKGIAVGGCSDSAFPARIGVPTLCGLGITGSGAHSREERADLNSLALQCKKLCAAVLMLPEEF